MSVPVDVTDLPRVLADFDRGYLLTVSTTSSVKAVSVRVELVERADGSLRVTAPGRGSVANAGANPAVTLLFPPRVAGEMSLLVDGTATVDGDDVRIHPTGAVLHKSAS